MSLEIKGKLHKILNQESGSGSKGTWTKQPFILITTDQYPKEIYFEVWGDKADAAAKLTPGEELTVFFNLESREYNDRWYTTARAWKWNRNGENQEEPVTESTQTSEEDPDSLPF